VKRAELPVYQRQVFRAALKGTDSPDPRRAGKTIEENDGARIWTTDGADDVLVISFKSKMNTVGPDVLDTIVRAVELAEASYKG
ncbi:hypothetical protein, partial [Escherichia coli]